jgi:hypothetical protein
MRAVCYLRRMNVLIISPGQDTGGQGVRIAQAFRRHEPDWNVAAMRISDNWIHYPIDVPWDDREAQRRYDEADVVHHKNGMAMYGRLDNGQRKPAIVHHQGSRLRGFPRQVAGEGESVGAVGLVSTVDLLLDAPGSSWLPTPYDLQWLRDTYAQAPRPNRRIRIGHAPTNRDVKNTAQICDVLQRLAARRHIEFDLIEMVRWKVCLSRKGRCDIFIDQLTLGYGNNAVESMAMEIPTVAGWADPVDRALFVEATGTEPPFVEATPDTLEEALEPLIASAVLRAEWGARGRAFVEAFHSDRAVVDRLMAVYKSAPPSLGAERLRLFEHR